MVGSQADRSDKNKLTILKLSDLHKTQVHPGKTSFIFVLKFLTELTFNL